MATATLSYNLNDLIGEDFDPRRTKVWITANVPLIVVDGTTIRLDNAPSQSPASDGTGSFTLVTTNSAVNPTSFAYTFHVDYALKGRQGNREQWHSSEFTFTTSANIAAISEAFDGLAIAPTWQSEFREEVEAIRDAQLLLSGISTPDSLVSAMMAGTAGAGPLTRAATDARIATATTPLQTAIDAVPAQIEAAVDPLGQAAMFSAGLRSTIASGQTSGFMVIGDSTGNETTEWAYLLAAAVAAANPALTVKHTLWDDAAQDMVIPIALQTGTAGAQYLDCSTGVATRSLPLSESPHTTGVVDVRVKVRMTDWTPAAHATLVAREGGVTKRSWYFGVHPSGKLAFYYSADGSTLVTDRISSVAVSATDGDTLHVRAVFTPNSTIRYYTSPDGGTWTQLGTGVTISDTPALGNVFNAAQPYELGGRQGAIGSADARIYEVDVRDGENGKSIVPRLPALWGAVASNAAQVAGAPVFTVVNGSHPGADLAYWTQARVEKALPAWGQRIGFLSLSHNELAFSGPTFVSRYAALLNVIKARCPGVPLVALTQNPQKSPRVADYITAQATRRSDIRTAAASAGAASIDTYAAFEAAGTATTVNNTDGVHPTSAGSQVWRDAVLSALLLP